MLLSPPAQQRTAAQSFSVLPTKQLASWQVPNFWLLLHSSSQSASQVKRRCSRYDTLCCAGARYLFLSTVDSHHTRRPASRRRHFWRTRHHQKIPRRWRFKDDRHSNQSWEGFVLFFSPSLPPFQLLKCPVDKYFFILLIETFGFVSTILDST